MPHPVAEIAGISGIKTTHAERRWFIGRGLSLDPSEAADAQILALGRDLRKALERASQGVQLTQQEQQQLQLWLYGKRRLWWRRPAVEVVLLTAAFVFGHLVHLRLIGFEAYLWIPLAVALAILVASLVKDFMLEKSLDMSLVEIKAINNTTRDEILQVIEKELRPRIIPLENREKVLRAATQALEEVLTDKTEDQNVIFIGAASLVTLPDVTGIDADGASPVHRYKQALLDLSVQNVRVTRYITLFREDEFSYKSDETKAKYPQWLAQQIDRLRGNSNYTLIDSPRAVPWGGSRSTIITKTAFLDIVGQGDSGFLIRDEELARILFENSDRLIRAANRDQTKYYGGGDQETVEELLKRLTTLRSAQ